MIQKSRLRFHHLSSLSFDQKKSRKDLILLLACMTGLFGIFLSRSWKMSEFFRMGG